MSKELEARIKILEEENSVLKERLQSASIREQVKSLEPNDASLEAYLDTVYSKPKYGL